MKKLIFSGVIMAMFLAGCGQEEVRSVEYYKENPKEIIKALAACDKKCRTQLWAGVLSGEITEETAGVRERNYFNADKATMHISMSIPKLVEEGKIKEAEEKIQRYLDEKAKKEQANK